MGASSSKGPSRADHLPPHGMRCLGVTLEICDLLDETATKKGKLTGDALRPRIERIRALVALWGQVDTELAQLTGEAVLTVAAAVSQFEEKLYKCLHRAGKLKKAKLMPQWKLSAKVDHILQDIEDAHFVFRGVLLHTLGKDFPAPAFPGATGRLPRMAMTQAPPSPSINIAAVQPSYDALVTAAEKGDVNAAAMLGDMHRKGSPPATLDAALAMQWFFKAAEGGQTAAQHTLGQMAESGEGISTGPDMGAAAAWYEKSALGGFPAGMADWAYFLEKGIFVQQWFKMGAAGGNISAASNLGMCYEEGIGVQADIDMAKACYKQAAAAGHVKARTNLGYVAMKRQQYSKATTHFKVAADAGDEDAMYCLACLMQGQRGPFGDSVPMKGRNSSGDRLMWSSAEKGDARAQYWAAAQHQENGNDMDAQAWLQKAAAQGHQDALAALQASNGRPASALRRGLSPAERKGSASPTALGYRPAGGLGWEITARSPVKPRAQTLRTPNRTSSLLSSPMNHQTSLTRSNRARSPSADIMPATKSRYGQGAFASRSRGSPEVMRGADAELDFNANIVQVHSDAIQSGLETIKKLLDGRTGSAHIMEDDDEDDEEFFEQLEMEDSFNHRPIAV
ncbi:hypothetical protein WJX73_000389 [Symbiochloris irregularis]|uniref:Uncharacterized protein n=1 Tax=Symbiochloris irregularis TaxID=706552 RepID=A0AAW1P8A4_9CHLO